MDLPNVATPEEVAKHFGWSERALRAEARRLGTCRILGNRMILTEQDVANLLEALRPEAPMKMRSSVKAETALPLQGDFAALVKLRERQAREARRAKDATKLASGRVAR